MLLFSAFRSKNTPTVPHQTIQLLCEKNEKIQKIMIFPIANRGNSGVLKEGNLRLAAKRQIGILTSQNILYLCNYCELDESPNT